MIIGLLLLGTIATNHSTALEAGGHTVASSLVGGYHVAFAIGAVSIAVGIVAARVVLCPREVPAATQPAPDQELARTIGDQPQPQTQRQAA